MDFKNQHLFVYGYVVTVNPNESNKKPFEVRWNFNSRSKKSKWEGWLYSTDDKTFNTGSVTAHCRDDQFLCTYFPVGYIPFIENDMYDVAIEILNPEELREI